MTTSFITIILPDGSEYELEIQPETVIEELEYNSWIITMQDLKDQRVELPFRFNNLGEASEMADTIYPYRLEHRGIIRVNIFAQHCVRAGEASHKPTGDTVTYAGTPEQLLEDAYYRFKYAENAGGDREFRRNAAQTLAFKAALELPERNDTDKALALERAGFQLETDENEDLIYAGIDDEFFLVIRGNNFAKIEYIEPGTYP
jgi:hypothetical protein